MKRSLTSIAIALIALLSVSCGYQLVVTSEPPAARVKINREDYGTTPLRMPELQSGVYRVEVLTDGYEPWQAEIELRTSQAIHAMLKPATRPAVVAPPPQIVSSSRTYLTVFAEPVGSRVIVDGKSRGIAKEGEGITIEYAVPPTLAEVEVIKPGFNRWKRTIAMESQRDNRVVVKLSPVSYWFDYSTDGEFMRKTVQQVVATTTNIPTLRRASRIAVLSITHAEGTDEPLQAVVEDALITSLAQAGFSPGERDDHMLVQLAHSTSGDSLPYRVLTEHRSPEDPFAYDAEIAATRTETIRQEYPVVNRTTTVSTSTENCVTRVEERVSSREETAVGAYTQVSQNITGYIPTADQFLAYRILECGLAKTPVLEGEPRLEPMLHRYAAVRVHLRVIDAKTGIVTWAGYLTGESNDEIPERVSDDLSNPPTRYTTEPLPDSWQRLRHRPGRHANVEAGSSGFGAPAVAAPAPSIR